jgi:hypothetical protein
MRRIVISLVVLATAWMVMADTASALGRRRARRPRNAVTYSQSSTVQQPTEAPAPTPAPAPAAPDPAAPDPAAPDPAAQAPAS